MGYDGFGNYTRVTSWAADKLAAIKITAARHDLQDDDYATALNAVMLRNGVTAMGGNLKLGGNLITGIAAGTAGVPSISASSDATTGIYFPAAGVAAIASGGVERARANSTGFNIPAGQLLGVATNTPRTQLDVVGVSSVRAVFEDTTYSAAALTGAFNVDVITAVLYIFDTNAAGNFSFNVRGDGANTLNSIMAVGQSLSISIEVPQGVTPFFCTTITVDGAGPSQLKWFNGAPIAGNASGIDVYTITVYKKAANTFYVRGSLGQVK